ncbi:MAG: aminotransferase DegT [Nitrosomonadaceae bacterium]|nr:aminotransferase DegT [Nitrosomonadaceae bacterium]|tara:strand:+ start:11309 stop:12466 length:1158 start_codon:yes stop_codon:yes gene_type:complete
MNELFKEFAKFVHDLYSSNDFIPLHEPIFQGSEKEYLIETINSSYVSSVGVYVSEFEAQVAEFSGAKYAIATNNGTAALHIALLLAGVKSGDEVITQSLTFVATCNAIRYCNAEPVFIDVDKETLGLSPDCLERFLLENTHMDDEGICINRETNRPVRVCMPMHTYGHPVRLKEIQKICKKHNIAMVEDAAESLGSYYQNKHTGTFGKLSALSFNGNKIITTGGGGMVLTNDKNIADRVKHITTTAKKPHAWAFEHDEIGFNYRMPNINAALGCAQIKALPKFLVSKRSIAQRYKSWFAGSGIQFFNEPKNACSNYWLNAVILENRQQRDEMLKLTNENGVMTRPVWVPMHQLSMNKNCQKYFLVNTEWLADRLVNIPSSAIIND